MKKNFSLLLVLFFGWQLSAQDKMQMDSSTQINKSRIQVALLLDTSNSMEGLVSQARSQLWKMVNEFSSCTKDSLTPIIEIALYEYGKSRIPKVDGFVRQITPLTTDLDLVSKELFDLFVSGGSEYCGWAIKEAVENLAWSSNPADLRIIIIAGNEAFYQGEEKFRDACNLALSRDIIVNTIFCGSYKKGIRELWKEGADIAKGKYMSINQEEKVYHYDTPFDSTIIQLNKELNATFLPFGAVGKANMERLLLQDANAASFGNANMRTRVSFKIKDAYMSGSWELVDVYAYNKSILQQIPTSDLPEEMQKMSAIAQSNYIEQKTADRLVIKNKINSLIKQAKAYIKTIKSTANGQTLDLVMMEAIRQQAKEKDFIFPNSTEIKE